MKNSIVSCKNPVVPALALAISTLAVAPMQAKAQANWPKPIEPPKSGVLVPIVPPTGSTPSPPPSQVSPLTPSVGTLPDRVGLPSEKSTTLTPVDSAYRHIPPLIQRMLDGKLTPQRAWDEKLISQNDLLWILTSYIDPWGSFGWKFNVKVRRGLAALLAEHGEGKSQIHENLPPTVRLWLADYYQSLSDEKCVALCESILKEIKTPEQGDAPLAFQAVERLGRYFAATGEPEKGAQTWLRMTNYYVGGWWVPDSLLEAARLYLRVNQFSKAQDLFERVPKYGNNWLSEVALISQVEILTKQNKHKEARTLLHQALTGSYEQLTKIVLLKTLGRSYFRTAEWALASKFLKEAIAEYEKLNRPHARIMKHIEEARQLLSNIEQAKVAPFVCRVHEIRQLIEPGPEADILVVGRISIISLGKLPLEVKTDNDSVTAYIDENWQQKEETACFYDERQLVVRIAAGKLNSTLDAMVTVSSPQLPGYMEQVLVHLQATPRPPAT